MSILQTYPQSLSDADLEPLYHKAACDPSSLSRAERNAVIEAPPPDVEDDLCVKHCGLTMEDLLAKTVTAPHSLSDTEASILIVGAHLPTAGAVYVRGLEQRQIENQWMWDALKALATLLPKARSIAYDKYRSCRQRAMADKRLWIMILEYTLDSGRAKQWGFVLFYHSDYPGGEDVLSEKVNDEANSTMRVAGVHHLADKFSIICKCANGTNAGSLRGQFATVCDGLQKGIRSDLFLYIDSVGLWAFDIGHPGAIKTSMKRLISDGVYGNILRGLPPVWSQEGWSRLQMPGSTGVYQDLTGA